MPASLPQNHRPGRTCRQVVLTRPTGTRAADSVVCENHTDRGTGQSPPDPVAAPPPPITMIRSASETFGECPFPDAQFTARQVVGPFKGRASANACCAIIQFLVSARKIQTDTTHVRGGTCVVLRMRLPARPISGGQWSVERCLNVAVGAGRFTGFLKQLEERLHDVDRHGKDDGGVLFGANLRQRLQIAQLHGGRNA